LKIIEAIEVKLNDGRVIKFAGGTVTYDDDGNEIARRYLTKDDIEDMLNSIEVLETPDKND
jgi:hypothetical protein